MSVGREPFTAGIGGIAESIVRVAAPDGIAGAHVFAGVFMDQGFAGCSLVDRGDRGEWGEIYLDQVQRVFGDIAVRGDDNGHRFADKPHLVLCDRPLQKTLESVEGGKTQGDNRQVHIDIGGAERIDHAGYCPGRCQIYAVDSCMGVGAAIDGHHRHVRQFHIVDITPGPGQESPVFKPIDRGTDIGGRRGHFFPARRRSAASSIASIIGT